MTNGRVYIRIGWGREALRGGETDAVVNSRSLLCVLWGEEACDEPGAT